MEDICKRIPMMASKVFRNLVNQDLIKCMEKSKEIHSFLKDERFLAFRIINAHHGNFLKFQDSWEMIFH